VTQRRNDSQIVIRQVDAFTIGPFAGNAAAVVLEAEGLSDHQMQLIAREMNLSETAFLLPSTRSDADLRLRWFTPSVEVDLCGHATVATFHSALEEGFLKPGSYRLECAAGVLPIQAEKDPEGRPLVKMGLPVPALEQVDLAACRIAEPLGIEADDIPRRLPIMKAGTWLLVPVSGLAVIRQLRPDFSALRAFGDQAGPAAIVVLTTETVEPGSAVHLRMFAPGFGIDEDPVTGSAQGPVAGYLAVNRLLPGGPGAEMRRYVAEQGDEIGRPGRIDVEVEMSGPVVRSIAIVGRAVTVLRGSLALPPR